MKLPGFTAEASLYKTSAQYHMAVVSAAFRNQVLAQYFERGPPGGGCGNVGQIPCTFTGCNVGFKLKNGLCAVCGAQGQPPCDTGCEPGLVYFRSPGSEGICQVLVRHCGNVGQIPCDFGCNSGLKLKNGLCAVCGAQGQPLCDSGCVYPLKIARGVCRVCGASGQIPCDSGCNQGLVAINGLCATPQPSPPISCSNVGSPCVPDNQPGTHCCQDQGTPEVCNYGFCKACIPHGAEVPPGGTQICCSPGDVPKLDQFSEKVVCDIPG